MSDQSPLGGSEEGVALDIRGSGTCTETTVLILNEQLSD